MKLFAISSRKAGAIIALVASFHQASHAQFIRQTLPTSHLREVVANRTVPPIDRLARTTRLNVSILLPLRNREEMTALLGRLYDESTSDYRKFLSVSEFTDRFGPTKGDYQAVTEWALAQGFTVGEAPPNRLMVNVEATVDQIENSFHVSMNVYKHPVEDRVFFAPDREPTVELAVPLWHISGLDDYSIPRPAMAKAKPGLGVSNQSGSGPSSLFLPGDMRAAYYGGTALTGSGQCVGLVEFGGYNIADVANTFYGSATYSQSGTNYTIVYTTGGIKYTIPVNNVALAGYTVGDSGDVGEQALDIAAAIGVAPGLSQVRVYTAPNNFTQSGRYTFPASSGDSVVFNAMASENICKQLSISWNWAPESVTSNDPIFQEFQMQGQSFFAASGDYGSWPNNGFYYPEEDPLVTAVGGTVLTTNGPGGSWKSEIAWGGANTSCSGSGSGGGISPDRFAIPSFQTLSGVINSSNHGSTTYRNSPDVAAQADCTNYYCSGSCAQAEGGTSYAAPRWAAYAALVNQQYSSNIGVANSGIGQLNNKIYTIGVSSTYNSDFHDINVGDNFDSSNPNLYLAVTGYDLVTGWGSPNGSALISALAQGGIVFSPTPASFSATVGTDSTAQMITVTNQTGVSLTNFSLADSDPTNFLVTSSTCTANFSKGASCTFNLACYSSSKGTFNGSIVGAGGGYSSTLPMSCTVAYQQIQINLSYSQGCSTGFDLFMIQNSNTTWNFYLNDFDANVNPYFTWKLFDTQGTIATGTWNYSGDGAFPPFSVPRAPVGQAHLTISGSYAYPGCPISLNATD